MKRDQTYINDLLKQYRNGSISDQDRHELERLALDDPFLFDSIEGYSHDLATDHQSALDRIKSKTQPIPSGQLLNMRTMSMAAGLIILVGALFWVNGQFDQTNDSTMSQVEATSAQEIPSLEQDRRDEVVEKMEAVQDTNADFIDIKVGNLKDNANTDNQLGAASIKEKTNNPFKSFPSPPPNDANGAIHQDAVISESIESSDTFESDAVELAEVTERSRESSRKKESAKTELANDSSSEPKPPVSTTTPNISVPDPVERPSRINQVTFASESALNRSKRAVDKLSYRTITGRVRDNTGEPLIGATINIPTSDSGATTDIDGTFKLEIDSDASELQIAYLGFSEITMEIDSASVYDVILDEDGATLDEVVMAGYASNVNEDNPLFVLPPDGRIAYKELIKNKALEGCNQSGKVKLKFTVTMYGKVTDFEVKKGLSEECNQKAIDIIKESGRWDNQFNKDKKVRYTISF